MTICIYNESVKEFTLSGIFKTESLDCKGWCLIRIFKSLGTIGVSICALSPLNLVGLWLRGTEHFEAQITLEARQDTACSFCWVLVGVPSLGGARCCVKPEILRQPRTKATSQDLTESKRCSNWPAFFIHTQNRLGARRLQCLPG